MCNVVNDTHMYAKIEAFIAERKAEFNLIPDERKSTLQKLANYVQQKGEKGELANLILICTHNSRRSHLSQVWSQIAARYYGQNHVFSYSGGTEATAMYPMAATALMNAGLDIKVIGQTNNPVYAIKYGTQEPAIIGFSKVYDDSFNPSEGFCAVMTCGHADENCPFIPNADTRIPITYEDPKAFDNTPIQLEKYEERSAQIAREMLYAFSLLS